jgi:sigma-E factor negative regulatory protein RseA
MNEKISALIDAELDELDERRVLDAVKNDCELRCTWERYHVIRAAMTRQLGVLAPRDLPQRVRARLDAGITESAASLKFWPLAGGFAAAASIAVIGILGLQTLREPATPVALAPASVAANGKALAVATPLEASVPSASAKDRLNFYIFGHNEFMPTGSMGNMLPYVRVVADNPDK